MNVPQRPRTADNGPDPTTRSYRNETDSECAVTLTSHDKTKLGFPILILRHFAFPVLLPRCSEATPLLKCHLLLLEIGLVFMPGVTPFDNP